MDDQSRAGAADPNELMRHIARLSSDELEGRAPGTRGERLTVEYLVSEFQRLGLSPGNPDGTYTQEVPLVGFTSRPTAALHVAGRHVELQFPEEFVAGSRQLAPHVDVRDSELVFVGYGISAPEFGWDDYKGKDLSGKTLLMLVGNPSRPDPTDPTRPDPSFFNAGAMTYYGRWTYKYQVASERGAAAALLIHETGPAGYGYDVVIRSWARENFEIADPSANAKHLSVEGWLRLDCAEEILEAAGHSFETLKRAAQNADFEPVTIAGRATFSVESALREVRSSNVVARLEGSDPALADEHVIYTAHWDHLGRDTSLEGHQVFNGAVDNATGVAALLEIARAFVAHPVAPRRSALFLATTAEESGLLGARYYATHPLQPIEETVANINMDMLNPWGRTRDIQVLGLGSSSLDDVAAEVAAAQGRVLTPDQEPEKGLYYRSDHLELMRVGIPAFYTKIGMDFVGKPEGFGRAKRDEYTRNGYHKVTDVVQPDWDLSGLAEDVDLLFEVGHRVAVADERPAWKPGAEFAPKAG